MSQVTRGECLLVVYLLFYRPIVLLTYCTLCPWMDPLPSVMSVIMLASVNHSLTFLKHLSEKQLDSNIAFYVNSSCKMLSISLLAVRQK